MKFLSYLLICLLMLSFVSAARLPVVGSDENSWGTILNEYLNISLDQNGTIRNNTINTSQIMDLAINSSKIATNAILTAHLTDNLITSQKISFATINASHIANNSILAQHIPDETIVSSLIANESIVASKIAANAINSTHLSNSVITESKLASNVINSTHIQDGAITGEDISPSTNLTVSWVNATVDLEIEVVQEECSGVLCTVTAACPPGKTIIFGFSSAISDLCDTVPLNCGGFCAPGVGNCSIASSAVSASIYIVCGKAT